MPESTPEVGGGKNVSGVQILDYYKEHIRRSRRLLGILACFLNVVDDLDLSLLTSADSSETHRNAFVVFIVCSGIKALSGVLF